MEKFPKILHLDFLNGHKLLITFSNGIIKEYDCAPLFKRPEFFLLKDEGFFKSVKIDCGGYGISWNDNVDISEYELWTNGVEKKLWEQNSIV
jgi:hypothetical protein